MFPCWAMACRFLGGDRINWPFGSVDPWRFWTAISSDLQKQLTTDEITDQQYTTICGDKTWRSLKVQHVKVYFHSLETDLKFWKDESRYEYDMVCPWSSWLENPWIGFFVIPVLCCLNPLLDCWIWLLRIPIVVAKLPCSCGRNPFAYWFNSSLAVKI